MATSTNTTAAKTDDVKFTITVNCTVDGEKRAVSYTVFKRTLMSQVFDSSVQFFKMDPTQVILVVKNKVALTHKCVEDYRLADKSVLELIHLKDAPTIELTLRDQAGNSKTLAASTYHPLSDVVKAFCKHLGEETGFSDLYHGGIALDLDASPASIGLKTGEQLFCYCYKAACKQYWVAQDKPDQGKSLRFIKFYFSDWKYGYKTFPIFRHDINTPMEVLIRTFCAWRGLDYEQTGFLYSYTYKQVQQGDTATNKALADGDTILAYSRQELQGRLWDSILAGSMQQVVGLLEQGGELSTSIGPEEWGKHPLHAAVANGHIELVKLLLVRGCDPNQLDYASDPPLWHAVENNLVELVELLLKRGACAADLSGEGKPKDPTGYSACPHAARKGHAETLCCLLAAGGNPWLPDADGYTAYDYALDHAKPPDVVRALLEGDPRFAEMQRSFQAAYQRMCQMLKRTQRYPALGCPCRTCNSLLEIRASETEASRQVREQIGCVALVRAVQAGGPHCVEVMELLYKHGALLDGQDFDGRTALHQAIRYNRLAEASWLIARGAHLDIPDFEGLLPLHQAGCSGFCDITKLLAEAGAPLNLHTIKYVAQDALDAQAKKQDSSKKAKRKQLDVSGLTTIGGNSPLALAIRHGHGAVVEYLLTQNAVFDLKNAADSSAFHAALDKGSASIAGLLLQHINKKQAGASGATAALPSSSTAATAVVLKSPLKGAAAGGGSGERNGKDAPGAKKREKEARAKEKENRDNGSAGRGGGPDKGVGSSGSGNEKGDGSIVATPSDSNGGMGTAEPPVAFDAGAGLREMVMKERERLRQQLGLSTPSSGAAASESKPEPKPMLSIFARNNNAGVGSSALAATRPATPAAHQSTAAPAPPPVAPAPPAPSSTTAGAAGASAAVPAAAAVGAAGSSGGATASAAGSATASMSATPASSTSSASPKSLTDEEGHAEDEGRPPSATGGVSGSAAPTAASPVTAAAPAAAQAASAGRATAPAPASNATAPAKAAEAPAPSSAAAAARSVQPDATSAGAPAPAGPADTQQPADNARPTGGSASGKAEPASSAASQGAGAAPALGSSLAKGKDSAKGNKAAPAAAAPAPAKTHSGKHLEPPQPAASKAAAAAPAAPAMPAASPIKVKFRAKPVEPQPAAVANALEPAGASDAAAVAQPTPPLPVQPPPPQPQNVSGQSGKATRRGKQPQPPAAPRQEPPAASGAAPAGVGGGKGKGIGGGPPPPPPGVLPDLAAPFMPGPSGLTPVGQQQQQQQPQGGVAFGGHLMQGHAAWQDAAARAPMQGAGRYRQAPEGPAGTMLPSSGDGGALQALLQQHHHQQQMALLQSQAGPMGLARPVMPPPGFGPLRPPSGAPAPMLPQGPHAGPGLAQHRLQPAHMPALRGQSPVTHGSDADMADLDSRLESMVLSVVDLGMEEAGTAAELRIPPSPPMAAAQSMAVQQQGGLAGSAAATIAAATSFLEPQLGAKAGAGAGGWPSLELAELLLQTSAASGLPISQLQDDPTALLLACQRADASLAASGSALGGLGLAPAHLTAAGSSTGAAGSALDGTALLLQHARSAGTLAQVQAHQGLAGLGRLDIAAPGVPTALHGSIEGLSLEAAMALAGGGGSGRLMARQPSHPALSRYDSGSVGQLGDDAVLFSGLADQGGTGAGGLRSKASGTSLSLFNTSDVWAADAGTAAKGAGAGGLGEAAVAADWGSGAASLARAGSGAISWQTLAEQQQMRLNAAMGAFPPQPTARLLPDGSAAAAPAGPVDMPPQTAGAGADASAVAAAAAGSASSAPVLTAAARAPAAPEQGNAAKQPLARGGPIHGVPAAPPPAAPPELEPLPTLPASLFDEDDGAAFGFVSSASDPRAPVGGSSSTGTGAAAPANQQQRQINLGSNRTGTPGSSHQRTSSATGQGDPPPPPPPPMAATGRVMYPQAAPGSASAGGVGMAPMAAAGGYGSVMYHQQHHAAAFGQAGAAYQDWYGAGSGYGGYRPPAQVGSVMLGPAALYGGVGNAGVPPPRPMVAPGMAGGQGSGYQVQGGHGNQGGGSVAGGGQWFSKQGGGGVRGVGVDQQHAGGGRAGAGRGASHTGPKGRFGGDRK